ncbi:hypothetical protein DRQ29_05555 [bacterium]|nr:MAG: hypothetical protein DRQ29_05555 [bacterium]
MLLCEFTDNNTPPITFSPVRDYVKMTVEWANENRFGAKGFNLLPPPYPYEDQMDYIWLKFLAPSSTSIIAQMRVEVMVIAKYRMP